METGKPAASSLGASDAVEEGSLLSQSHSPCYWSRAPSGNAVLGQSTAVRSFQLCWSGQASSVGATLASVPASACEDDPLRARSSRRESLFLSRNYTGPHHSGRGTRVVSERSCLHACYGQQGRAAAHGTSHSRSTEQFGMQDPVLLRSRMESTIHMPAVRRLRTCSCCDALDRQFHCAS